MILPDHAILEWIDQGRIGIDPFDPTHLQPASYDITLDKYFRFYVITTDSLQPVPVLDPKSPVRRTHQVEVKKWFELGPQKFVLASSIETFTFGNDTAGRCEGKSSLGRMGLLIHATAGFFDPGFSGTATLELFNANQFPIRLYPGMRIAQMSYHQMFAPARNPYGSRPTGSKYQRQGIDEPGPRESEYFRNFQ